MKIDAYVSRGGCADALLRFAVRRSFFVFNELTLSLVRSRSIYNTARRVAVWV